MSTKLKNFNTKLFSPTFCTPYCISHIFNTKKAYLNIRGCYNFHISSRWCYTDLFVYIMWQKFKRNSNLKIFNSFPYHIYLCKTVRFYNYIGYFYVLHQNCLQSRWLFLCFVFYSFDFKNKPKVSFWNVYVENTEISKKRSLRTFFQTLRISKAYCNFMKKIFIKWNTLKQLQIHLVG